jgi:hypothetical protein
MRRRIPDLQPPEPAGGHAYLVEVNNVNELLCAATHGSKREVNAATSFGVQWHDPALELKRRSRSIPGTFQGSLY